jgi:hypothetical protein
MLTDGYGVLVGTLNAHDRDPADNFGKWYHVHLHVGAQERTYDCAIDVDSHESSVGVEWKVLRLRAEEWSSIASLSPGYHPLAPNPRSGALDYIRDPRLRRQLGCVFAMMPDGLTRLLVSIAEALVNSWEKGSHEQATLALESILEIGRPVQVFGEPFRTGFGQHNVHQNQGDPIGSRWAAENGIWQDGGTIVLRSDGSLMAFISKFTSQSYKTDDQGHPI